MSKDDQSESRSGTEARRPMVERLIMALRLAHFWPEQAVAQAHVSKSSRQAMLDEIDQGLVKLVAVQDDEALVSILWAVTALRWRVEKGPGPGVLGSL